MNQTSQEEAVRLRAYQIWQDEGQPDGQDIVHWHRAAQEILAEDGQQQPEMDETEAVTQATTSPQAPPMLSAAQKSRP